MREGARRVKELSERYGLAVDPDAVIEDVTVGQQQRVEILKTLYRDARILVLDEPTAVLTAQEAGELFEVLRALKEDGVAIVFISHKLGEVLEIADRITVLRRGKQNRHRADRGLDRGEPRAADGRPRRAAPGREERAPPPATPCSRSRTCGCSTTASWRRCAGSRSRCARGRSWRWRAWTATASTSWSRRSPGCGTRSPAASGSPGEEVVGSGVRADRRTPGSPTSPRTATCAGSCWTSRSPRTSPCASTTSLR